MLDEARGQVGQTGTLQGWYDILEFADPQELLQRFGHAAACALETNNVVD